MKENMKEKSTARQLFEAVFSLVAVPFMYILDGWAMQKLWGWFVTPAFGVQVPSVMVSVGLVLTARWLSGQPNYCVEDEKYTLILKTIGRLTWPAGVVFMGWVITKCF